MKKCLPKRYATCVAMAEYIAGSEDAFVQKMNERAQGLGMKNTNFVNCCGLDVDGHVTTAYDVALMSRELINSYPQIHDYCTVWMEDITHVTAKGESVFTLTNTNKLIRQYQYATGLKTGSTSQAGYCVSATATKDDVNLIAVVMHAADHSVRFSDATTLLNYGFSVCSIYKDDNSDLLDDLEVTGGNAETVPLTYASDFTYVDVTQQDLSQVQKTFVLPDSVAAPVTSGDAAGYAEYTLNGEKIGTTSILYGASVEKASFGYCFLKAARSLLF